MVVPRLLSVNVGLRKDVAWEAAPSSATGSSPTAYGQGWIVTGRTVDPTEVDVLLSAEEYRAMIEA
jgi:glycine cleavage system H lipoate-binding protein